MPPPSRVSEKLVTGASGTVSKVVRMPPWTWSTWPSRTMSIWPFRAATRSGRLWPRSAQVDRAFEGLFEQRRLGLGVADIRAGRALFAGVFPSANCDPGAEVLDVGVVEELRGRAG